jgi:integrase
MPKNSNLVLATEREVRNAKPNGERTEFRIKGAKNLVLRITPRGHRTWAFLYANPSSGQRRKLSIGTYPAVGLAEARNWALALTLEVQGGKDPLTQRRTERAAETFAKLAERYLTEHERRNARNGRRSQSTDQAERILCADILPVIGSHRAEAVTKQQISEAVEAAADRGSFVIADRILGLIRAIYNWGIATGALEVNPTMGLKKRNTSRPRQRVLDDDEIRALWRRLDTPSKLSQGIRDSLKLQLLLGVRISEAIGAAKSEFDLKRRVWVIPAERTKADREHRLPLSPWAMTIIESAVEHSGRSPWLFPSSLDGAPMRSRSATRAVIRFRPSISLGDIGTHDLRRTMATGLGDMGTPDEVIERVLNHAPRTVAGRHYNHAKYLEPMRRALEAWAERVQAVVNDHAPTSNVVVLRAGVTQ